MITESRFPRAARCGALLSVLLLLPALFLLAVPAYAGDTDAASPEPVSAPPSSAAGGSVPVVLRVLSPVMSAREDTASLTPDGSLERVDDLLTVPDGGAVLPGMEFLTVKTRSGAVYYLIIDRASSADRPDVYFLNAVDDTDLIAVLEQDHRLPECTCETRCAGDGCDRCRLDASACAGKAADPAPSSSAAGDTGNGPDRRTLLLLAGCGCAAAALVLGLRLRSQKAGRKRQAGVYPGTRDDAYGDEEE